MCSSLSLHGVRSIKRDANWSVVIKSCKRIVENKKRKTVKTEVADPSRRVNPTLPTCFPSKRWRIGKIAIHRIGYFFILIFFFFLFDSQILGCVIWTRRGVCTMAWSGTTIGCSAIWEASIVACQPFVVQVKEYLFSVKYICKSNIWIFDMVEK